MQSLNGATAEAREALQLFDHWLDLDETEQRQLVADAAARNHRVYQLLVGYIRADDRVVDSDFLREQALRDVALHLDGESEPDASGQRIGAWVLQRSIGIGGMGRVWLAERSDGQYQRVAAIKMLRAAVVDPHANKRFALEGHLLAQLAHPNIAMLLDAGFSADGQRYLVLEYIDGERIDVWCDAQHLGIEARIALFLQVCAAVTHAHGHLIVHRDLKPSNILVMADGQAKLLDFGIAKLLEAGLMDSLELTGEARAGMTPAFAAPEQIAGGAITVATDVYALGVLLYRLLAGESPYGEVATPSAHLARCVLEQPPRRLTEATRGTNATAIAKARATTPAGLFRLLRGDLDTIVARALKKNPAQRYASVDAFAADLRRYLGHRPITARADSRLYRLRKFSRRHWKALLVAASFLVVVVISSVLLVLQAREVARETKTTAAVKDFLFGLFTAVDPWEANRSDIKLRDLVDRGAVRIDADASGDPRLRAQLQTVIGRLYGKLGVFDRAEDLESKSIAALATSGASPIVIAQSEIDYSMTLREKGDLEHAQSVANEALARLPTTSVATALPKFRALNSLGDIAVSRRTFADARAYAQQALELAQAQHLGAADRALGLWILGSADWGLKSLDAAENDYREALRLIVLAKGEDGLQAAMLHGNLAMIMRSRSRYTEALGEDRKSLDISQQRLSADNPRLLSSYASTGLSEYHLGHYGEARRLLQLAVDGQRAGIPDNPALAGSLINLGLVLIEVPDLAAAETCFSESLRIWEKKYGRDFPGAQAALAGLGRVHALQRRWDLADSELNEVAAADGRLGTQDDYSGLYWRGELRRVRGDLDEAVRLDRAALVAAVRDNGEHSRYAAFAHHYLGLALRDKGDTAAAEAELRAALVSFSYVPAAQHPWAATTRIELATLPRVASATALERQQWAEEAVAIRESFFGSADSRTAAARAVLASLPR